MISNKDEIPDIIYALHQKDDGYTGDCLIEVTDHEFGHKYYHKRACVPLSEVDKLVSALELLLNILPKGDSLRYFHGREEIETANQALEAFKSRGEAE